jgi:hypothetical protein
MSMPVRDPTHASIMISSLCQQRSLVHPGAAKKKVQAVRLGTDKLLVTVGTRTHERDS